MMSPIFPWAMTELRARRSAIRALRLPMTSLTYAPSCTQSRCARERRACPRRPQGTCFLRVRDSVWPYLLRQRNAHHHSVLPCQSRRCVARAVLQNGIPCPQRNCPCGSARIFVTVCGRRCVVRDNRMRDCQRIGPSYYGGSIMSFSVV